MALITNVTSSILAGSYYEILAETKLPKKTINGVPFVTDPEDVFLVEIAQTTVKDFKALLRAKSVNQKDAAVRFKALSLAINPNTTDDQLSTALIEYNWHPELVRVVKETGRTFVLETTKFVKNWGDTSYNWALMEAAAEGRVDDMKVFNRRGATDYDAALVEAARNGRLAAMKLLKKWGATDFDWALARAAGAGRTEAMALLKSWGASDYQLALACAYGNAEAISVLNSWLLE